CRRQSGQVLLVLDRVLVQLPRDLELVGDRPGVDVVAFVRAARRSPFPAALREPYGQRQGAHEYPNTASPHGGGSLRGPAPAQLRQPAVALFSRPRSRPACRGRDPPRGSFAVGGSPSWSGAESSGRRRTPPATCR